MHGGTRVALTCAAVLSALALASGAIAGSPGAAVVWYKFNGGPAGRPVPTAVDSGPNHLDAAGVGPLTYGAAVPPRKGDPFSLNATGDFDYAAVSDTPLLDLTGNFTLSLWAKPIGAPANADPGDYIVIKDLATGFGNCLASYGVGYNANTGQFSASISGSSDINVPCVSATSFDSFPLGKWHFVSMRYAYNPTTRRAVLTLFVDGVKEGQTVVKDYPGIAYGSGQFLIGAANFGSGDHDFYRRNFFGYIDEVKITAP